MSKKLITLFIILFIHNILYAEGVWQRIDTKNIPTTGTQILHPMHYTIYSLDTGYMHGELLKLDNNVANGREIALPMPDGSFRTFRVWQNNLLPAPLAARYPGIKTFTAYATDNYRVTAKLDYTLKGFHAIVFDGDFTTMIDPYSNVNDGYYICYYRKDYDRPLSKRMTCVNAASENYKQPQAPGTTLTSAERLINGNQLRTYRLALACTGEYAQVVSGGSSPTKALALSAMTTSMNRVNGVYERELSITMQFVTNEDTLIFLVDTAGCYNNSNGGVMMTQNQDTITRRIGAANYDIGHVFSTGGGGIAQIGCVCQNSTKAEGVTGALSPVGDAFDIDYVAHEMGHQFGADHTFNDNSNGSCAGNGNPLQAYEPGSGSTLMAYAGICDNDNLQDHSDDYFHTISLNKIITYTTSPALTTCPTQTNVGNKSVALPSFTAIYAIPYLTPFELTAPLAVDSVADTLNTYCWEEWDLGDFGQTFNNTHVYGPIFRSFHPDTSRIRVFPRLDSLLQNKTNYMGEKLSDSARILHFKLAVRAIYNGTGSITIPDDSIVLHVINTGTPFAVTEPNSINTIWAASSMETVTWNVANTTAPPINCQYVDIYLSKDGGYTYPYLLQSGVPNTGSATVILPNIITSTARIKVKGAGNVFFDISNTDFSIVNPDNAIVYPTVTSDKLYARFTNHDTYQYAIFNTLGQTIMHGEGSLLLTFNISGWSKGMYIISLVNKATGTKTINKFVVR